MLRWNEAIQDYDLWFVQSFSSKALFQVWRDGLLHGVDMRKHPFKAKLGKEFVKYYEFKPRF